MFPISAFALIIVTGKNTIRPGIRCLSAFIIQTNGPAIVVRISFTVPVRIEVHTRKCQIIIKVICCTNMPDPVIFTRISAHNILELHITGSQVQRIAKITGNLTAVISVSDCFSCNNIIDIEISIVGSLTHISFNFNTVAIGSNQAVSLGIHNIAVCQEGIDTACLQANATNAAIDISTFKICALITLIIAEVLNILDHSRVSPVIIDLTIQPQTATQVRIIFAALISFCFLVNIAGTNFTSDFYII